MTPLLGIAIIAAAGGFAFVLNRAAKHELWAHRLGVACFIVAATAAGAVAHELSDERRCARVEYSNVDSCMTPVASASRDFVILGMPAVVAAVLLAREPTG
ncbi:MAG: hypothetical protein IPG97_09100 [Microthrixaceae bacterium]|nr:hypothetical protein [Microthrixaceae bacterium]